jgi:hypothetical protein
VFRCHLIVEHFSLVVEVKHVLERFRSNVSKGQLSLICRLFREIALHIVVWGLLITIGASWALILMIFFLLILLISLITFRGEVVDKSWSVPYYLIVIPPDRNTPAVVKAVPRILEMSLQPVLGRLIPLRYVVLNLQELILCLPVFLYAYRIFPKPRTGLNAAASPLAAFECSFHACQASMAMWLTQACIFFLAAAVPSSIPRKDRCSALRGRPSLSARSWAGKSSLRVC